MALLSFVDRRRTPARLGLGVLATALLLSTAGCGSRASDQDIVDALRATASGPAAAGEVAIGAPAAASAVPGAAQAPAVSGNASGQETDNSATAGRAATPNNPKTSGAGSGKAAAAAPGAAAPQVASKSQVTVGMIGPFSGVLGVIGASAPKTLAAWAAHANSRGGVNGHPVKLIAGDDQGDPATALTLVKRMVESDKIIAMVGNINVFGFAQVEKYTKEKGVPLIGGDAIDPGYATSTNAFLVSAPVSTQIVKGLQLLVTKGASKIAVMYCLEVSAICSYLTEQAQKSEVGPKITQTYQVSLVAPSYTSQCIRMKDGGIDALYMLMDTAAAARVLQNCATQGFKPPTMLLGLDATKEMPSIPALADSLIPGATFSPATAGVPAVENYRQVMAAFGPSIGNSGITSLTWAAAEMFALIGTNLSANPTSAELYEALWKVKDQNLGGLIVPVSYAKGKPSQTKPCMFLWGVQNGAFSAPQGAKPVC